MPIRLLIADDHPLFRLGLKLALQAEGFEVSAEAENGEQALLAIANQPIDIAILDIKMPRLDGLAVCSQLQTTAPQCLCILLTTFTESSLLLAAREVGAKAFVSKDIAPSLLAKMIQDIAANPSRDWLPIPDEIPHLSPRELEVLQLFDQGFSNKQIAQHLGLSLSTVKEYAGNLYRKLEATDRITALNRSRSLGLL